MMLKTDVCVEVNIVGFSDVKHKMRSDMVS